MPDARERLIRPTGLLGRHLMLGNLLMVSGPFSGFGRLSDASVL